MDDFVSLEESQADIPTRNFAEPKTSKLARLVIRSGLAKDERTAQISLLLVALLLIVLAFFLYSVIKPSKPEQPSQAVIDAAMHKGSQPTP